MSSGALRNAHLNIFRSRVSARANTFTPPYSCIRAGPRQPNITLPYNRVETGRACISYILTLLLNNPNKRVWHIILLNAAFVLYILCSNIADGLLFALLIISPKYLNSYTFSRGLPLHLNWTSVFIYIAFVLPTFIFNPLLIQNFQKQSACAIVLQHYAIIKQHHRRKQGKILVR